VIYLTQLIYIKAGEEPAFHQFEDIAIPTISKYNGRLLLRIRPTENSIVEHSIAMPYEIHIVEFETEDIDPLAGNKAPLFYYFFLLNQSLKITLM
jgi:hypothetical protein